MTKWSFILAAMCALSVSQELGCRSNKDPKMDALLKKSRTLEAMGDTGRAMVYAEAKGELCPATPKDLVEFLVKDDPGFASKPFVDSEKGRLLDGWKNDIVLVVENGHVVGLGSGGPNGIWEGGKNDDVVCKVYLPSGDRSTTMPAPPGQ